MAARACEKAQGVWFTARALGATVRCGCQKFSGDNVLNGNSVLIRQNQITF